MVFFSLLASDSNESDEEFYDFIEANSESSNTIATQNNPGSMTTETNTSNSSQITDIVTSLGQTK